MSEVTLHMLCNLLDLGFHSGHEHQSPRWKYTQTSYLRVLFSVFKILHVTFSLAAIIKAKYTRSQCQSGSYQVVFTVNLVIFLCEIRLTSKELNKLQNMKKIHSQSFNTNLLPDKLGIFTQRMDS